MISFPATVDFTQPMVALDLQRNRIDLTGATALTCVVYPRPREGQTVQLTLTVANSGISVTDADQGEYSLVFEPGDLTAGTYECTITVTLTTGADVLLAKEDIYVTANP